MFEVIRIKPKCSDLGARACGFLGSSGEKWNATAAPLATSATKTFTKITISTAIVTTSNSTSSANSDVEVWLIYHCRRARLGTKGKSSWIRSTCHRRPCSSC